MSNDDLESLVTTMQPEDVIKGDTIVCQGDPGDKFYIIEQGRFEIIVNGEKVLEEGPGASFGELALLYNKPRAATVVAASKGRLWTMDQASFTRTMEKGKQKPMAQRYLDFLRSIPTFKALEDQQLEQIGRSLVPRWFEEGQTMLKLTGGEFEERFLVLRSGEAKAMLQAPAGMDEEITRFHKPGTVMAADVLKAAFNGKPVEVQSCSDTTVALCMSVLTLDNILKSGESRTATSHTTKASDEQCVCM